MNTTNLFVELIVIGVGTAAWIVLLVLSFSCLTTSDITNLLKIEMAIPLLAVIYVLGIVTDRIADTIFEKLWGDKIRQRKFGDLDKYYLARREILTKSERLSDLLEYGRSRLRICRGWCFNSILIIITLNLFLWFTTEPGINKGALRFQGTISFIILTVATWYSWKKLVEAEYRKVLQQAKYLTTQEGVTGETNS